MAYQTAEERMDQLKSVLKAFIQYLADLRRASHKVVAQISKSAVSQVSKPAALSLFERPPIWKSAIQQAWKPALRPPWFPSTYADFVTGPADLRPAKDTAA